jgi:membrane-associated protein
MEGNIIDIILHINKWLQMNHGPVVYIVMFILVFCETGLFFTPFLPGDSLIFAVGALCASQAANIWLSILIFIAAGVLGDTSNYHIGKMLGPRVFRKEKVRFLNKNYLDRAHSFYEKHGSATVVLGHFFPIVRTFVPFVAGMGSMTFRKFLPSNILGVSLWVALFINLGYWVGSIKFVQDNFGIVEILIIAISCIPAAITFIKERNAGKARKLAEAVEKK